MQWFYDLKVGSKLIAGFLLVAAIAALVGGIGVYKMREFGASETRLRRCPQEL